jgi:TM2 domain-containing membrane protein YozV
VALVLSVIFAGLGQLYLGLRRRGLIFAVVGVVLVAWFYSFEVGDLYPLLWAYGIYDTYRTCIRVAGLRPRVAPVIVLVVLEIVALLFVVGSFLG